MIGIPCSQIPERPLPVSDLALTAAGIAVPADHPICPGLGVDLLLETTQAFGAEVIDPIEVGLVRHNGRQELP